MAYLGMDLALGIVFGTGRDATRLAMSSIHTVVVEISQFVGLA